jgi:hypothetical protein
MQPIHRPRRSALTAVVALCAFLPLVGPAQADPVADIGTAAGVCDPLDGAACLLPFPNDFFTVADASTSTGKRLNLNPVQMPRNIANVPMNPVDYNRNDGFSPGSLIISHVPGLDFTRTGAPPINDVAASLAADSPVVVVDATTGSRYPIWSEPDANATGAADSSLLIHPGINFLESHRYVVALRHMKDAAGADIAPNAYFTALRAGTSADTARQARFNNEVFQPLTAAGVGRDDLYLAWDFTVASERNLSERILHMRDESFSALNGMAPSFVVETVTNKTPAEDSKVSRTIEGHYLVPSYMDLPGGPPGSHMLFDPTSGLPFHIHGNNQVASFTCNIPRAAVADFAVGTTVTHPARPSLYGHGLLGQRTEVSAGNVKDMGNENNFVFCATEWAGMALEDIPNVAHSLVEMSNFATMADRMQQGLLNQMFLGRLMITADGLASDPAFKGPDGASVIDRSELFYDGNSQGGIMGGALVAVSPDIRRAVLGVPASNYSILLNRSVDFDEYSVVMYQAYPNKLDQQIIFSLIQLLWDRGEANGYLQHLNATDPYPNTPPKAVLLHEAYGDHQVANVATEVEARTIGARIYQPARATADPYWGLEAVTEGYLGNVYVIWDDRAVDGLLRPAPPTTNQPPRPELGNGNDPHGHPRGTFAARVQKSYFLQINGFFHDVCNGGYCTATSNWK